MCSHLFIFFSLNDECSIPSVYIIGSSLFYLTVGLVNIFHLKSVFQEESLSHEFVALKLHLQLFLIVIVQLDSYNLICHRFMRTFFQN